MNDDSNNEIITMCRNCLNDVPASLDENYFICAACGHRNELDNEGWKAKRNLILKKVFGTKPAKPENN